MDQDQDQENTKSLTENSTADCPIDMETQRSWSERMQNSVSLQLLNINLLQLIPAAVENTDQYYWKEMFPVGVHTDDNLAALWRKDCVFDEDLWSWNSSPA